jgi:hypothetical protein
VLIKGHFILSKLFATSCPLPHRINLQGLQPASWTFGTAAGSYKGYWSDKFDYIDNFIQFINVQLFMAVASLRSFYVLKVSEANKLRRRGKQKTDSEKNMIELA